MSKTQISFTRMTCERCDETEDIKGVVDQTSWGHLGAYFENGSAVLTAQARHETLNLCPKCAVDLVRWWERK